MPQHILIPFVARVNIFFKKLCFMLLEVLFSFSLPRIASLFFQSHVPFPLYSVEFGKWTMGIFFFSGVSVAGCLTQQDN